MKKQTFYFLLLLLCSLPVAQVSFAQLSEDETVYALIEEAIGLMDSGNPDEAIELLEDAAELAPEDYDCRYEMAYAYNVKGDYAKAIKILKPLAKHPGCNALRYHLLGTIYAEQGHSRKAIKTYEEGMERFPDAGPLYLGKGDELVRQQHYGEAERAYMEGVKADPFFLLNYSRAAQLSSFLNDPTWALILSEAFVIMAGDAEECADMSKLMFDTYRKYLPQNGEGVLKSEICDSLGYVRASFLVEGDFSLAPPIFVIYDILSAKAVKSESQIDLASLNRIRTNFFALTSLNLSLICESQIRYGYPVLASFFSYVREVERAGHMEAYNYWILQAGNEDEFMAWYQENRQKADDFIRWYNEHRFEFVDPQELLNELQAEAEEKTETTEQSVSSGETEASSM